MTRSRGIMVALWMTLLVGPTPGAVGSCGGDDATLDEAADLPAYCREREELVCVRRQLRDELTGEERDDCRRSAIDRCAARFWPGACRPTRRQTEACLNALRLVNTLDTPVDELDACHVSALRCAGTEASSGPQSIGADGGVEP